MQSQKIFSSATNNLLFLVLLVIVLRVLQPVIVPLLFAIILSVSIFPLVKFLEHKLRFNRTFSALTAILLFLVGIAILFTFIGIQISDILDKSNSYAIKLELIINSILTNLETKFNLNREDFLPTNFDVAKTLKNNFTNILNIIGASGSILSDMFLIPLYMFFFLFFRNFFQEFFLKLFSNGTESFAVKNVIQKLYKVQHDYLIGLFTVMGIVGVLNSLGLFLLGIENPFFYGFLAALLLLIPYIGIIIGSLIPTIIALVTKDSYFYAIAVIGLFVFIQFLEGNFITPKITGSKVSINAFVAILAIIIFSMLWGTSGMILALPIVASLKIIFDVIPSLSPYGFLLSEPEDIHLQSKANLRLKTWKHIRKLKKSN